MTLTGAIIGSDDRPAPSERSLETCAEGITVELSLLMLTEKPITIAGSNS